MKRQTGIGPLPALALFGAAAMVLLCTSGAWAAAKKKKTTEAADTSVSTTEQQRLDQLSGQVNNLSKTTEGNSTEIKNIEKQMVVAVPTAGASPATVGEHVGALEKDYGDFKTSIQQNLGISVHGLVDAGYEHNFNQPVNNVNALRVFDHDGFQLTQGNLHIEKDGTVGFVTDLNVGQVANTLSAATHYSNVAPVGGQWFDPTQYYLTYTAPVGSGIALQAGRFVTLLGEETINTYNNLNYNESKSLLFGFGIPFTHTGVRGTYTINDYVAVTSGLNNGWDDPAANNNGGPTGELELMLNNKDKTVVLALNGIYGSQTLHKSNGTRDAINPVFTWKPTFLPNVTLVNDMVYGSQDGPAVNGHSGSWIADAVYLVYDWNAWEFASRGEMFDDKDGLQTSPDFNGNTAAKTLWEFTQTVSYKVPNVTGLLARLEYRHDNSNVRTFTNNNFVNPVTGVQRLWRGQDTLGAALIYAF